MESKQTIASRLADTDEVTRVMREAIRVELRRHKLLGHSIAESRDGKIVLTRPEDIHVDEDGLRVAEKPGEYNKSSH
jgi:hypothetical protein